MAPSKVHHNCFLSIYIDPTEAPSDILLTGVTQSSLKFTWKPPQDCQTQNGNITSYSYKLQNVDGGEVRNGTTEKTYVALGDLEPNRKYYFMVSAVNSEETGPYSEPVWEETRYRSNSSFTSFFSLNWSLLPSVN